MTEHPCRAFVEEYCKRGWYPIPIQNRSKKPPHEGWPQLRISLEDIPKYFNGNMNIGIITGPVSKGLTDIDLDTDQAIRLAPLFLKETLTFGRKSRPSSHFLYISHGSKTKRFKTPSKLNGKRVDAVTLLELRYEGMQTVFPGSCHEVGEKIEWYNKQDQPTEFQAADLLNTVTQLATASLLIQFGWSDNSAVSWAKEPKKETLNNLPPEVIYRALVWSGLIIPTPPLPESTRYSKSAVDKWNSDHPLGLPIHSGPCPVCNDHKSFGRNLNNPKRWACFSSDHPEDVGRLGPSELCYTGDFLEIEAFQRDISREEVLIQDGYLNLDPEDIEPPDLPSDPPGPIHTRRPEIYLSTEIHDLVNETISILVPAPELFQRGGSLSTILTTKRAPMHGVIFGEHPEIKEVSASYLEGIITKYAKIIRTKKTQKGNEYSPALPPDWMVRGVLSRGVWEGIRPLEGLVEAPIMRLDGTVLDTPGYDSQTGLVFTTSTKFKKVKDNPTKEDAKQAAEELLNLVCDFPFCVVGGKPNFYQAAWLSALLTPFVRPSIPTAPMFLVDSNVRGSGKSMLCDIISTIANGRPMPRTVNPAHEEEFKKLVTSFALAGTSMVMIDNITGALGSQALDAVLTAPTWKDRILGKSEVTAEIPMAVVWFATGNNVELKGDLCRRTIHIRLKSDDEMPETRNTFTNVNLMETVRSDRAHYVNCALTILRAYTAAGKPAIAAMRAIDFKQWSSLVRGAIMWLGYPDPGETQSELGENDTDRAGLAMFIMALEKYPESSEGLTTSEIVRLAIPVYGREDKKGDALREALGEICPNRDGKLPSTVTLGKRLGVLRSRVVNGKCIDYDPSGHKNVRLWKIFDKKPMNTELLGQKK